MLKSQTGERVRSEKHGPGITLKDEGENAPVAFDWKGNKIVPWKELQSYAAARRESGPGRVRLGEFQGTTLYLID
jgi:hypothetical protein